MPETIEAEVIEIDGVTPSRVETREAEAYARARPGLRGTILKLDRRWWPVWLLLGVVVVVLVATLGVVMGVCYLIFSVILGIVRAIFGGAANRGPRS